MWQVRSTNELPRSAEITKAHTRIRITACYEQLFINVDMTRIGRIGKHASFRWQPPSWTQFSTIVFIPSVIKDNRLDNPRNLVFLSSVWSFRRRTTRWFLNASSVSNDWTRPIKIVVRHSLSVSMNFRILSTSLPSPNSPYLNLYYYYRLHEKRFRFSSSVRRFSSIHSANVRRPYQAGSTY